MGTRQNELDGLVRCFPAIGTGHNRIVTFFPAYFAVQKLFRDLLSFPLISSLFPLDLAVTYRTSDK